MVEFATDAEILGEAVRVGATQLGGTLATMHAEDGTPYVTFVLFHLRQSGEVLFGSGGAPQHTRNMDATPEVSFLIDNREMVASDWNLFDRVVIIGRAERIEVEDGRYDGFLGELSAKNEVAAGFTRRGNLFCIHPRRLIMMKGLQPHRYIIDFDGER